MLESIITALVLALSPVLVSKITGLLKALPRFAEAKESRKPLVRSLVAVVSVVYVVLTAWVTGAEIDATQLNELVMTAVTAFIMWLSTLGWYHAFKS